MPAREIIRIDTEREDEENLTLPSDCLVRPTDGRKPFIVRERHLMIPSVNVTSSGLSLFRGSQVPTSQNIAFERRNNIIYAILAGADTVEPPLHEEADQPFITVVVFREELRTLPQAPQPPIASTSAAAIAAPAALPAQQTLQVPSQFTQANAGSLFFPFGQSQSAIAANAIPTPAALIFPAPPTIPQVITQTPPPPPQLLPPPHLSSTTPAKPLPLFGVFSQFFPIVDDDPDYEDEQSSGNKRKRSDGDRCCGLPMKKLCTAANVVLAGSVAFFVASTLSKSRVLGLLENAQIPAEVASTNSSSCQWLNWA